MTMSSLRLVLSVVLLSARLWAVDVTVEDPDGNRIPAARVTLKSGVGRTVASAETSATGEASLSGRGSSVEVVAAGFEPKVAVVPSSGSLTVKLALATVATSIEVAAPAMPAVGAVDVSPEQLAETPSTDLVENLRETPGVNILRRGGTNFEPVVEGLRETQVAMVVDGTRTFAAGPARMDSELSHVEPGQVADVEIITGPYALTKAAGAFGAILVKSPETPRYSDWRMGGVTSLGYRTNGAGRFARMRLFGGNSRFGVSLRGAGNKGNDYRAGDRGPITDITIPGDYSNYQFGGKVRLNPTDHQEVALEGLYDEQTNVDFPGRLLNAKLFVMRGWNGTYYVANPTRHISTIKLNLYLNKKGHRMTNAGKPTAMPMAGRVPPFALDISLPTESDTFGGAGRIEFALTERWRLITGFDFYDLNQDAQRFISRLDTGMLLFNDTVWPDVSINDQGFFVETSKTFSRGEIVGAFRADLVEADAGRPSDFFLEHAGSDLNQTETNLNGSFLGRLRLMDSVLLSAGVGNVRRTANALERYSDRFPSTHFQIAAEFMGLPTIKPESSTQGDLNLEVVANAFRFSVGGFVRRIDNFITVMPDASLPKRLPLSPPTVYRYINGDHASFRGYQFSAQYRGASWISLRFRGAKTIADDKELNEPAAGIPPLELNTTVRLLEPSGRFWAEYVMRNVFDQQRAATLLYETLSPGFTTHDLRFGVELGETLALHFGVENIGDKHYFEHLNAFNPFTRQRVPELGRNFYSALTLKW